MESHPTRPAGRTYTETPEALHPGSPLPQPAQPEELLRSLPPDTAVWCPNSPGGLIKVEITLDYEGQALRCPVQFQSDTLAHALTIAYQYAQVFLLP